MFCLKDAAAEAVDLMQEFLNMPKYWASDNSDAVKRMEIQYSTSIGYPVSSISAHVTAVPNHQNGRVRNLLKHVLMWHIAVYSDTNLI